MKTVISIILNVLSVASAVLLFVFGAFCVYDIFYFSSTPFAGSIDFWVAMRFYIKFLFAFSISGIILGGINFIISPQSRLKTLKVINFIFCIVGFIAAIVLIYLANNF